MVQAFFWIDVLLWKSEPFIESLLPYPVWSQRLLLYAQVRSYIRYAYQSLVVSTSNCHQRDYQDVRMSVDLWQYKVLGSCLIHTLQAVYPPNISEYGE